MIAVSKKKAARKTSSFLPTMKKLPAYKVIK